MMRARFMRGAALLLSLLVLTGCFGEGAELARLHEAQRDFWRAKHSQRRLDIYPNETIAEDCVARYSELARRYPLDQLPDSIPDPDGVEVKLARVGAMSSLGAAGILRELGRSEEAIAMLAAACRADLPLGSYVERRLRNTLASFLLEAERFEDAVAVYHSLLTPLRPGLPEDHAAYPDAEAQGYPGLMMDLAAKSGSRALFAEVGANCAAYFEQVGRDYPGGDAEWLALFSAAELSIAQERWEEASRILERLARRFPDREAWRPELRRARLLREQLGRIQECETILSRWADPRHGPAAVEAGKQRVRMYLESGRLNEAEEELRRVKKFTRDRGDKAEFLYLWGRLEMKRGSWEEARPRLGQSAANHPYTPYGMESQLLVAEQWSKKGEARFAARALDRLFRACRRNTRHNAGSETARIALAIESRADSLLGTLPAKEPTVRTLLAKRNPKPERSS